MNILFQTNFRFCFTFCHPEKSPTSRFAAPATRAESAFERSLAHPQPLDIRSCVSWTGKGLVKGRYFYLSFFLRNMFSFNYIEWSVTIMLLKQTWKCLKRDYLWIREVLQTLMCPWGLPTNKSLKKRQVLLEVKAFNKATDTNATTNSRIVDHFHAKLSTSCHLLFCSCWWLKILFSLLTSRSAT